MGNTNRNWPLAIALGFLVAGCATITTGTTQTVDVSSSPDGAECTLSREGRSLGKVMTPGVLTIKRGRLPISVVCIKDGYEDSQTVMNAHAERATYGNAVLGGIIGMAIDSSSGANGRYDPSVSVELTALSAADQAARARNNSAATSRAAAVAASVPLDGDYRGGVLLGSSEATLRAIQARIAGGRGDGTVTHALCRDPGKIEFVVDPSGTVNGEMDARQPGSCGSYKMALNGRAENGILKLSVKIGEQVIPFSLTSAASSTAALASPPAAARTGSWTAHNVIIAEKSAAGNCASSSAYSLDLAGDTLTVDNSYGRMLTIVVPPDGLIDQPFRSPSGNSLAVVGNARTRDLEIVNSRLGCRWKLTPD